QAIRLLAAGIGIENILRIRIKRRESRDGGNQHAHGVGVVVESVEKFLDALVNERMVRDVVRPIRELRLRGKFAVENQIRSFEVVALLGELFDRIAAIAKTSFVAVDEGNLA